MNPTHVNVFVALVSGSVAYAMGRRAVQLEQTEAFEYQLREVKQYLVLILVKLEDIKEELN